MRRVCLSAANANPSAIDTRIPVPTGLRQQAALEGLTLDEATFLGEVIVGSGFDGCELLYVFICWKRSMPV